MQMKLPRAPKLSCRQWLAALLLPLFLTQSTMAQAPVIVTPPQSQSVSSGSNVTFSVAAAGAQPLYYQWLFNEQVLPDATNATLTITNARITDAGSYFVFISNNDGSTNSPEAI